MGIVGLIKRLLCIPAVGDDVRAVYIQNGAEGVVVAAADIFHSVQPDRAVVNVLAVKVSGEGEFHAVAKVAERVAVEAGDHRFDSFGKGAVVVAENGGAAQLGFDIHTAKGFDIGGRAKDRNESSEVGRSLGAMERGFVEEVGNVGRQKGVGISLAAEHHIDVREAASHVCDNVAALAMVDAPKESNARARYNDGGAAKRKVSGVVVVGHHKPVIGRAAFFRQHGMHDGVALKNSIRFVGIGVANARFHTNVGCITQCVFVGGAKGQTYQVGAWAAVILGQCLAESLVKGLVEGSVPVCHVADKSSGVFEYRLDIGIAAVGGLLGKQVPVRSNAKLRPLVDAEEVDVHGGTGLGTLDAVMVHLVRAQGTHHGTKALHLAREGAMAEDVKRTGVRDGGEMQADSRVLGRHLIRRLVVI